MSFCLANASPLPLRRVFAVVRLGFRLEPVERVAYIQRQRRRRQSSSEILLQVNIASSGTLTQTTSRSRELDLSCASRLSHKKEMERYCSARYCAIVSREYCERKIERERELTRGA